MAAIIPMDSFLNDLPVFSFRNSPVESVVPIVIRFPIPAAHHWCPVDNMDPDDAVHNVGTYIRSAFAILSNGGLPDAEARPRAILMGAARAKMTTYYKFTLNELSPRETVDPIYNYVKPPNGAGSVVVKSGADQVLVHKAQNMADLDANEQAIVVQVISCAIGIPPLQGLSLIKTGHDDYVTDRQSPSYKSFVGLERQFFNGVGVRDWISTNRDIFADALWHKAAHPIVHGVKEGLARSYSMKQELINANIGAAAMRLPAKEDVVVRAETYLILAKKLGPLITSYGGSTAYTKLEGLEGLLSILPEFGSDGNPISPNWTLPPVLAGFRELNTRGKTVALIGSITEKNASKVAWMYGYYCGVTEYEETSADDRLKNAYSLKRLKRDFMGFWVLGIEDSKDYRAFKRSQRISSNLPSSPEPILDLAVADPPGPVFPRLVFR